MEIVLPLARSVAFHVEHRAGIGPLTTGSSRYDGERVVAMYQMAAMGLAQLVLDHPSHRGELLPAIRAAADALVAPETWAFGGAAYNDAKPFDAVEQSAGHAYLGYLDLALGMVRAVDPDTKHAALHDRLTVALARHLAASNVGVLETYPGEAYPPDIAMVIGAIGLHGRVTGADHGAEIESAVRHFRARFVDARSGFVHQSVDPIRGTPRDAPRGSGTAVSAFALAFADADLAGELHRALVAQGRQDVLSFAGIAEYPPGHTGDADVDAGLVFLGVGATATAFAIGSARIQRDAELFEALARTAETFGDPQERDGRRTYTRGGAVGDAALLAMYTAGPLTAQRDGAARRNTNR